MKNTFHSTHARYAISYTLALLCGIVVVLMRLSVLPLFFTAKGTVFSLSDFFVLLSAGLCGLQGGILTFLVIFFAELAGALAAAPSQGSSLFSLLIYLLLILMGSYFSSRRWYRNMRGTLLASGAITLFLGGAWYVLAYYLLRETELLPYHATNLLGEFADALPEVLASQLLLFLLFRYLPDSCKERLWMGRLYTSSAEASLQAQPAGTDTARLVTWMALAEGALLSLFAVCLSFLQIRALPMDDSPQMGDQILLAAQMFLLILCAAIPVVIGINEYLRRRVSEPLTKEFMIALSETVDAKDHYTSGHSKRVVAYAREIARRAGMTAKEQDEVFDMALLHDIGKIGVSEAVINKRARLTEEEYAEIKQHPLIGYEILSHVQDVPRLSTGARWHHERYDGTGYPDGLAGDNIPPEARILRRDDLQAHLFRRASPAGSTGRDPEPRRQPV